MNADIREISKTLRPPIASSSYQRRDLHNLLDEANSRRLIVISGPQGAGKSTLLATYIATRKLASIWYQVDSTDKDLATFFHYFGIAAGEAIPRNKLPMLDRYPELSQEKASVVNVTSIVCLPGLRGCESGNVACSRSSA